MILIIAEKPSVAKTIATVVGATQKNNGYYEGNGYLVTNAFGHMYKLYDVSDYDPEIKGWNIVDYPFIPANFKYKTDGDKRKNEQIKTINKLASRSKLIINATDADREGSVIFYEIYSQLKSQPPVKRLWTSTQTEVGIKKALSELIDDDGLLEQSGLIRQQIDWLIGINCTTLYTLKSKSKKPIKIGRVVLPTLYLIYQREQDIKKFTSSTSYSLFALDQNCYRFQYHENEKVQFDDKKFLQKIAKSLTGKTGTIKSINRVEQTQSPNKLFSLVDLQGHISSTHNSFTASKVLKIAQSLYEKGVTTYPRTESRYLQNSMIDEVQETLSYFKEHYNLGADKELIQFHSNKSVFNDPKVESHYAIIPTGKIEDMNQDEKIVFDAIVQRFLSCFMPKAIFEEYKINMECENKELVLKGKNLIDEGYLSIHKHSHKNNIDLNIFSEGATRIINSCEVKDIKKKPPKRYTERSLLQAMQSCGKSVEDETSILKGYTIGTASTRAETIEKLKANEYISIKGKSFHMTEFGNSVIRNFPATVLFNVDFTGKIEKNLKDIENGHVEPQKIYDEIVAFSKKQFNTILQASIKPFSSIEILGKCPLCGGNIVENSKAFSCNNSIKDGCIMTLWKEDKLLKAWGIKLTKKRILDLIEKGYFTVKGKGKSKTLKVSVFHNEEHKKINYKIEK